MAVAEIKPTFKNVVEVPGGGWIALEACEASDLAVANAARVSLHRRKEQLDAADVGLIGYLMRERHGTPFEHGYFRFVVSAPIFVFREWHRHRVGHSYNEWSARYSTLEPKFYVPDNITVQTGKPGAYEFVPADARTQLVAKATIQHAYEEAYGAYERLLMDGVARQVARMVLPVATFSEMYWSCNPRSLMHFLSLRNSPQAQEQIRQYAEAAERFFEDAMPTTAQAFLDNGRRCP